MTFKHEPHSFTGKAGRMPVCVHCGLIPLNNLLTDWAMRNGCNHQDHPEWTRVRVELVRRHQEGRGL
jgi:hypothetical protein